MQWVYRTCQCFLSLSNFISYKCFILTVPTSGTNSELAMKTSLASVHRDLPASAYQVCTATVELRLNV